jgi:hypothetical protein
MKKACAFMVYWIVRSLIFEVSCCVYEANASFITHANFIW